MLKYIVGQLLGQPAPIELRRWQTRGNRRVRIRHQLDNERSRLDEAREPPLQWLHWLYLRVC